MIRVLSPDEVQEYIRPHPSLYGVQRLSYNGDGFNLVESAVERNVTVAAVEAAVAEIGRTVDLSGLDVDILLIDGMLVNETPENGFANGVAFESWIALSKLAPNGVMDLVSHELAHVLEKVFVSRGERAEFFALIGQEVGDERDPAWEKRPQERMAEYLTWGLFDMPLNGVPELDPALKPAIKVWALKQLGSGEPDVWLQIDNPVAMVAGRGVVLDAAPIIVNGRTLVPLRFIAEALGCEVTWDENTRTVTIRKV